MAYFLITRPVLELSGTEGRHKQASGVSICHNVSESGRDVWESCRNWTAVVSDSVPTHYDLLTGRATLDADLIMFFCLMNLEIECRPTSAVIIMKLHVQIAFLWIWLVHMCVKFDCGMNHNIFDRLSSLTIWHNCISTVQNIYQANPQKCTFVGMILYFWPLV